MSGRTGHYMRSGARPSRPLVLFSVVVVPQYDRLSGPSRVMRARFLTAYATARKYRRGKWRPMQSTIANSPRALFDWMAQNASRDRVNWVISPVASDTLTLCEWWSYAESQGVSWRDVRQSDAGACPVSGRTDPVVFRAAVARQGLDIFAYRQSGLRWRWVSERNYWPDGCPTRFAPGEAGEREAGEGASEDERQQHYGRARAVALSDAVISLSDWWMDNARCGWGSTTGQLAMGLLRSHAPPKCLCTHQEPDVWRLERDAAHGGRVSLWYSGSVGGDQERAPFTVTPDGESVRRWIPGPAHQVDVSSMYPALMRDMLYPVSLQSYQHNTAPHKVVSWSRSMGVIARVTIRTERAEYPLRVGDRVTYPVGTFTTCLTGPEISHLSSHGEVIKCHEIAIYRLGRPFVGAVNAGLNARRAAESADDAISVSHAKLLTNSIAGKLAQRSGGWVRDAKRDSPGKWGEHYTIPANGAPRVRRRYLAGLCWRWEDDDSGKGPYTFAFDYIAAYGRMLMAQLRERCPAESVIHQATDSLWLTDAGISALADVECAQKDGPGALRLVKRAQTADFIGSNAYCANGEWVLAGFHNPTVIPDSLTVYDTFTPSIWSRKGNEVPDSVDTLARKSRLRASAVDGHMLPSGWIIPTRLAVASG